MALDNLAVTQLLARESLMVLRHRLVMPKLVYTDYSESFAGVGQTINIRVPAQFDAHRMGGATTNTITVQTPKESTLPLTLNKRINVSIGLTPEDRTLVLTDMEKIKERVVIPALVPIITQVEQDILAAYKRTCSYYGAASTMDSPLEDLSNVTNILNNQRVPDDGLRRGVLGGPECTKIRPMLTVLDAARAAASEATNAADRAYLGRPQYSVDYFESQLVPTHVRGTLDAGALATGTRPNPATVASTQVISIAAGGNGGTLKAGDLLTFAGCPGVYVVTEDGSPVESDFGDRTGVYTATSGGVIAAVPIYPLLKQDITGAAVTVMASHAANMAFHKNAIAFASRPLEKPLAVPAEVLGDPETGINLRAVYAWDTNKMIDVISIEILYGVRMIDPRLAVRILGAPVSGDGPGIGYWPF